MNADTRSNLNPDRGGAASAEQLLALIYHELRDLARAKMRRERSDHTLQATALVHETYLRLLRERSPEDPIWGSRERFFAAAAEAMRRILVESIRRKKATKRGGAVDHIELDDGIACVGAGVSDERVLALDEALERLEELDQVKASLVKLRIFSGFTKREAAEALGIPERTADRHWKFAKAWLIDRMSQQGTE